MSRNSRLGVEGADTHRRYHSGIVDTAQATQANLVVMSTDGRNGFLDALHGTQSERGNRFAERIMTVTHTARKQKKNVFEFLTECCRAWTSGKKPPLLLPARAMPP